MIIQNFRDNWKCFIFVFFTTLLSIESPVVGFKNLGPIIPMWYWNKSHLWLTKRRNNNFLKCLKSYCFRSWWLLAAEVVEPWPIAASWSVYLVAASIRTSDKPVLSSSKHPMMRRSGIFLLLLQLECSSWSTRANSWRPREERMLLHRNRRPQHARRRRLVLLHTPVYRLKWSLLNSFHNLSFLICLPWLLY